MTQAGRGARALICGVIVAHRAIVLRFDHGAMYGFDIGLVIGCSMVMGILVLIMFEESE